VLGGGSFGSGGGIFPKTALICCGNGTLIGCHTSILYFYYIKPEL
jgi:hypothetical protein